ncbi:MAG: DKNYY domain-containing protein [Candidatus Moraniibacteriota bacterium]
MINKKIPSVLGIGIILIIAGFFGYIFLKGSKNKEFSPIPLSESNLSIDDNSKYKLYKSDNGYSFEIPNNWECQTKDKIESCESERVVGERFNAMGPKYLPNELDISIIENKNVDEYLKWLKEVEPSSGNLREITMGNVIAHSIDVPGYAGSNEIITNLKNGLLRLTFEYTISKEEKLHILETFKFEEIQKDVTLEYGSNAVGDDITSCIDEKIKKSINYEKLQEVNSCFIKDDKNVYVASYCGQDCMFDQILSDSDPNTFIAFDRYAKDKNNVYYVGIGEIKEADQETFIVTDNIMYAKDKNNVYYAGYLIKNADTESFEIVGDDLDGLAKDKNSNYFCTSDVVCGTRCKITNTKTSSAINTQFTTGGDSSGVCK